MTMHPDVEKAFEQIDAAVFSGDTFTVQENRMKLREYLERWTKFDKTYNYYAPDGTLMTHDGKRSIFDDVDE